MNTFKPELGYLWRAGDKGTFSPNVGRVDYTKEQAEAHNRKLDILDREYFKRSGRATLYLTKDKEGLWSVQNFTGTLKVRPYSVRRGSHNWGCERFDAWFWLDGIHWHGVNLGDNQLLRCKRTKGA